MKISTESSTHYIPVSSYDEKWGIVCTTVGYQDIVPYGAYPRSEKHGNYNFKKNTGRILNEYQMVYITEGEGEFESASCKKTVIKAGTIIMLFPGEWHSYSPKQETGWKEWWVGFIGTNIDQRVENGFFSPTNPIFHIGYSFGITNCYQEIVKHCETEARGFQILISSIVLHILGSIIFKKATQKDASDPVVEKINQARMIMKDFIGENITTQEIAQQLGIGYSWFRHKFKDYVGISPAQYQLQLKYLRAKELLSEPKNYIQDVAFQLGFDSLSQFSTFFKSYEGISPRAYKQQKSITIQSLPAKIT